jgi:uncharacterized membrane protein YoaT (DUF817 family)
MISEILIFIKKQAACSLFGALMLFALITTRYVSVPGIYRYDLLLIFALVVQLVLIATRLETPKEIVAIVVFHICAMAMEIFKTSPEVGAWNYPEPAIFAIAAVPLFTGFLYSSVGSYMARASRINKFVFTNMPRKRVLLPIAVLIYVNFFTNHFTVDIRWAIFAFLIIVFWKTKLSAELTNKRYSIHPLVSNGLLALFVWFAEQIGTFAQAWIYPNQEAGWEPVTFHMLTSWYLLLIFSFILISLIMGKKKEWVEN